MATKLACFVLFMIMSMAVSPTLSSVVTNAMDYWCDKTPNPQPCKYFMRQEPKPLVPKTKSEFRKVAVRIALERALHAETHTKWLGKKCRNDKEKAAWADWFVELRVSDYVLPLIMSNNVSKLISNALALTSNASFVPQSYKHGFPSWLKAGDRKLLQSSSPTPNLVVARDRMDLRNTIITGSRSVGDGSTTFDSATVAVTGEGFIARGITFHNTAGPQKHQAVALRSGSDLSVFYRCGFEGYQDTLYVHSQRQFYKECYIYGTVDFIFGNAAVVLQNCMIYARRPMDQQKNMVTAQGRTDPNQNTGIIIHGSRVMATADLSPVLSSFKTFLGRPWKEYSRTVFMKTYLDSLVDPAGWLEWDGDFALNTSFYGEYQNIGPAAPTSRRVKWKGYRVITSATEASKFTVANFIAGTSWLPNAGIPFTPGL
ncbi:hypothetical protein GOBAR_DD01422 [Gossypium barbadense]|nr:hypothetical protein GOBAR_DD01422 [Gossypium barbadense]